MGIAKRRKGQSGQSLVETALVILPLTLIIVGIVDAGQIMLQIHYMKDRARTTARWAATHTDSATSIKNYAVYGTAAGRDGAGAMGLTTSNVTVTVTPAKAPGTTETITVAISKPLWAFTPYVGHIRPRMVATATAESLGAAQ